MALAVGMHSLSNTLYLWVTSDLKALLNEKKRAFTAGDPAELRRVQRELKRSLKESKDAYRKKLEERLERNQTRDVWSGMRTITGFQKKGIRSADGNMDQANELNQFFNRFDSSSPSPSCPNIPLDNNGSPSHLPEPRTPLPTSSPSPLLTPYIDTNMSPIPPTGLSFTSGQVRRELERLNQRKAAGPDGISPQMLRNCSRQLCGILQHLFNQSIHLQRIPVLWKTSCLVPVPKKTHPVAPSDYRPIALTSHIMKVMERLVLSHLRPLVSPFQDPLQFAYQPKVGVDDAVIYLLKRAYSSLDRLNTTVRVMFFDFSSAFNTIQPRLLRAKLEKMQMDAPLVSWIEDYLTADLQYHSETCHLQKYSDDTVIVGCVENGQEDEYRDLVESFVRWRRENLLQLNVTKMKEIVVDFSKSKSPPSPVCISGKDVEIVPSYRFLGVQLDKLEWSTNTDAVYKKAMSRLYFLRRLRSFSVCSRMLHMFYQCVMASTIFFAVVCWAAGIKAKDANRLNKLIKKAGSVVGCKLANLDKLVRGRMVLKVRTILYNPSHLLHNTVDKLRSSFSSRLLQPRCSKERYRKSFLPSVKLFFPAKEQVTFRGLQRFKGDRRGGRQERRKRRGERQERRKTERRKTEEEKTGEEEDMRGGRQRGGRQERRKRRGERQERRKTEEEEDRRGRRQERRKT
ncbi:hypothetical protein D4764_04G0014140 [Takifugu flavidus]|uniref:Reverse transcriptase domain-containing protein n=1 Tax=Takifugu flavidus TaxID=433684 RepID=A0A5C6NAU6_9TELE|nr:hypothetical protein D4764_04G0014140 [Takifugu flavidus]